jgi:hypothetical protein
MNEIKNDIKNDINNIIIEKFEQNEPNEPKTNSRRYAQEYINPVGKIVSDIIITVLQNNNINVNNNIKDYIRYLITIDFNNKISNIIDTLTHDENHIIDINNNNTIVICFIIIVFIVISLIFIYTLINFKNIKSGIVSGGVESKVYITSAIIIFNIIFFLTNFYFFAQEFKYLGNVGDEELIVYLLDNIKI